MSLHAIIISVSVQCDDGFLPDTVQYFAVDSVSVQCDDGFLPDTVFAVDRVY